MPLLRGIQHRLARLGQWIISNLRDCTKPYAQTVIVGAITDVSRSKQELILENALLRQQLMVVKRQVKRPKLTWRERALLVVLTSRLKPWRQTLLIVQPATVLRWHRDLFRWVWRRKTRVQNVG